MEGLNAASFTTANETETIKNIAGKSTAAVTHQYDLLPGKQNTSNFLISWHFANAKIAGVQGSGRFYQTSFNNALAVAQLYRRRQNYSKRPGTIPLCLTGF